MLKPRFAGSVAPVPRWSLALGATSGAQRDWAELTRFAFLLGSA